MTRQYTLYNHALEIADGMSLGSETLETLTSAGRLKRELVESLGLPRAIRCSRGHLVNGSTAQRTLAILIIWHAFWLATLAKTVRGYSRSRRPQRPASRINMQDLATIVQ